MAGLGILLRSACESSVCFEKGCCNTASSAEDKAGPTAICQITTCEPEPQLELPFEDEGM